MLPAWSLRVVIGFFLGGKVSAETPSPATCWDLKYDITILDFLDFVGHLLLPSFFLFRRTDYCLAEWGDYAHREALNASFGV